MESFIECGDVSEVESGRKHNPAQRPGLLSTQSPVMPEDPAAGFLLAEGAVSG
jgi:hypothetical protein